MNGDETQQARIREMQRDLAAVFALWSDVDRVVQLKVLKHAIEDLAGELRRELWGTFRQHTQR